ncbi:hypothetical protein [Leucobacter sp. M11]|uniref:hypothetical protein n=1 Tax=Leucobacter sp. M11 TaxID=2993565 RepID=UPI002D7EA386|nr:hypothetical protein [Leucobacter sp. M11]MEB4615578.1 hypothetical protein [Leucobacter sp. M11]
MIRTALARPRARAKRSGRARAMIALGSLVGVGVIATAAIFTDFAKLTLGGEGGLGSSSKFDIAVIDPEGAVAQADTEEGLSWPIPAADVFVPGHTVRTEVTVFNNAKTIPADVTLSLNTVGDGSVGDAPNITRFLLFSAVDLDSETVLFGDPENPAAGVALAEATRVLDAIPARGVDELREGEPFVPGADGSARNLALSIHYLDVPETEQYNGGQAALSLRFDAQSR